MANIASSAGTTTDPDKDQAQFIALMNGRSHKEEVKKLQENVTTLVEAAREYTKTGSVAAGTKFASTLNHFSEKNDTDIDKAVLRVAETITTLENMRHALLQSLESEFVSPFDNFLKVELKSIAEYERKLNKARDDYDISQTKYEQVRKKKAGAEKSKAEQELLDCKHAFEVADMSYLNKLVELDAKKQYELSDRLLNFVIGKANYYKQAHEMLKQMEPFLQDARQKVIQSRKDLTEQMSQMTPEKIEDFVAKRFASSEITTKQGYLLLKGKRRWLTVQNGHLEVYKSWKDLNSGQPPTKALDMLLCSVKLDADAKEKFTFTLTSNEDKVLPLQAMNQQDLDEWLLVLKNSIAQRLKRNHSNLTRSTIESASAGDEERKKPYNTMRSLSQANCFCADCGKRDPDWAAYNLGVIICFECSGVHRSLGTHISRVRSLTLDKWDSDTFFLLRQFGNQKANEIWEAVPSKNQDDKKPPESCDRPTREKYIKAKYVQRKFVQRFAGDQILCDAALVGAALANDYHVMLRLFAQSADPNAVNDSGQNLLMQAIIDGRVTTYTVEFLIQNGAKLINTDPKGWTALHYAAMLDRLPIARVLMRCGADANAKDKEGKTPIDIAANSQSKGVHKFLTSGEYTEPVGVGGGGLGVVISTSSGSPSQIAASQKDLGLSTVVGASEREKLAQYRETMGAAIEGLKVTIAQVRGDVAQCNDEALLIDLVKRVRLIKQNLYEVSLDQSQA